MDNRQPFKSRVGPSGFCALTVLVVQGGAALATLSVLLGLAGRTDSLRAQFGLLVGQASSAFWTTAGLVLLGVALGVVLALGGLFLRKRLVRSARASKNHRRQEELAQVYLDVASVALVALDSQGRITMLNRKGHEILGYHEGELIGQSWFNTCVPEGIRKNVRAVFERFMAGELPLAEFFENDVMTRSGKLRRIAWHNVTLTDNRGRIVGTLSSGQDVTAQKQFEKEREELIKKLESQNTELERFTYMVSHDLKSPLITVKGYLGLASEDLREGDTDAVADSLHRMTKAADRMEALLAELLELSRIGRLAEPSEDVSLEELAHEAVEIVAGRLNQRGVSVEIAKGLPTVFGDRQRLLEVLQNLVDNAAKFMGDQPDPRIEITARTIDNEVVCLVHDNGVGVEPRYHQRIFGLFDKLSRDTEGSGVGLAMIKRIVEVHDGRVWVESEGEGRGSTFGFAIPCRKPEAHCERILS